MKILNLSVFESMFQSISCVEINLILFLIRYRYDKVDDIEVTLLEGIKQEEVSKSYLSCVWSIVTVLFQSVIVVNVLYLVLMLAYSG